MEHRVGVRAVQKILMQATQSNLSMFHNAGNITESIFPKPSIKDILDLTSSSSCSMNATIKHNILKKDVILVAFKDILIGFSSSVFIETEVENPEDIWYTYNKDLKPKEFLRLYINAKKIMKLGFTLKEIASSTLFTHQFYCSPDFMGIIDVKLIDYNQCGSILSFLENAIINDSDNMFQGIVDLQIERSDDKLKAYTIGSSISTFLQNGSVYNNSIKSNNIKDVESIYGIEAAKQVIISLINDKEGSVIANFMTRSGSVKGLKKDNLSAYGRGFIPEIGYEHVKNSIVKNIGPETYAEDKLTSIYSRIWSGF